MKTRFCARYSLFAVACSLLASCVQTSRSQPVVSPPPPGSSSSVVAPMSSPGGARTVAPLLGICVHAMNNPAAQARILDAVARSGATSLRDDVPWKYVETTKGAYQIPPAWDNFVNAANSRSIKPILILDYGNQFYDGGDKPRSPEAIAAFAKYATYVVRHFAGRVKYYEIWNEWDNTTGGFPAGTPSDYMKVFNATYPAVKTADPSAVVLVGAGIQKPQFYEELARAGVVAKADGIAIHPYNNDPVLGPEVSADFLLKLEKEMVTLSGRPQVDIYVTEIGWSTPVGPGKYTEAREAQYAYRTVTVMAALPFVKGVWWYDLRDDGTDPNNKEDHFGLLHNDWSPKVAFDSFSSAVAFDKTHQTVLSDLSNLTAGKVLIDARSPEGAKSMLIWNFHDTKPSLYAHCVPGKGLEVTTTSSPGDASITAATQVDVQSGTCNVKAIDAARVAN